MCGIVGYLNLNSSPASETVLKKMTDSIIHRGPDGEGQYVNGACGLGHRRLSIIDLSNAGSQPMQNDNGRYVISYNGEIYNYKEIRNILKSSGYQFFSNTDTEVVLKAYEEWGEEAVKKLNGMFAFAIWDKKKEELFLARDRYGIKPLYYYQDNKRFVFGSENKAIFASGFTSREIDKKALVEYMTFQNFFSERTLFENIKMFPQGFVGKINKNGELKVSQYWDFHFQEPTDRVMTYEEYLEELDFLIRQAVNRQLVSDVEIGSYLSGGMDSGSLTCLASQHLPYIKTFTVGFDLNSASGLEMAFDERSKAEHMSYLFKTEHYEMVLKSGDMERCMDKLVYHLEEPRVGQCYPNFYASKLASKFTKVVLSGAGGDEIFAGYPWRYYRSVGHKDFEAYIDDYYLYWQRLIPNKTIHKIFEPIWGEVKDVWTRDIFRDVYKNHSNNLASPEDYINHSLYFEAKTFLHGLLVVEDKLSMAHSLETRVPFLDNDLVDFAQKVPVNYKLARLGDIDRVNENSIGKKNKQLFEKTNDGKLILRDVMSRYIPSEVTDRVKQGFSSPDASWFKGESIDFVKKELNEKAKIYHYFKKTELSSLINEHLDGRNNQRLLIWSLLNLERLLKC